MEIRVCVCVCIICFASNLPHIPLHVSSGIFQAVIVNERLVLLSPPEKTNSGVYFAYCFHPILFAHEQNKSWYTGLTDQVDTEQSTEVAYCTF